MKDDTMNVMTNLFCEALIENDRERLSGRDIKR